MNYLNRFSRLNFLKEAATKAKDLEDLRKIFVNKYPGDQRAAGLSIQYYQKFIKKSDPSVALTEENLPQPLPDDIGELLKLIQSQKATESKSEKYDLINKLKEENPSVDFSGLEEEQIRWLYSRYIEKKIREGEVLHRIEDAIVTLKNFMPIYQGYKTSDELRKKLEEKGIKDIPPLEKLTAEDMERIIAAESSDLSVRVHGVEIKPEEFLGKFGEWNLWLPHTKETSVKIAGYDESFNPKTTWCTARTRGSNLFYNYIGRKDIPSFLFYIIKDNPKDSNDWLSLGYISYGNNLKPDFSGRSGGLSVNRDNEGLREENYSKILGEEWNNIKSKIESELQKYKVIDGGSEKYISPARSIIEEIAKDVSKFRKEFYQKSVKEKKDFCNVILDSNPSDDILKEIYSFMARNETVVFLDRYFDEPLAQPYLGFAAKEYAFKEPKDFLEKYSNKPWAQDFLKLAAEEYAKEEPNDFIYNYSKEPWAQDALKIVAEGCARENPSIFISYLSDKPWAQDYLKIAAEECARRKPIYFIRNYSYEPWAQDFLKLAAEECAKQEPIELIRYHSDKPWAQDALKLAAETLAKKHPGYLLEQHSDKPWAQDALKLAAEGVKKLAKKEPFEFLDYNAHKTWAQPYLDSASEGAEELARKNPSRFLNYLSDKPWAQPYIKLAAEILAKKSPDYFINNYSDKPWAQDALKLIAEELAKEYPYLFIGNYSDKPWAQDYLKLAAEELLETKPSYLLTDEPWARDYIGLALEKCTNEDLDYFIAQFSDKPWAKPYIDKIRNNQQEPKTASDRVWEKILKLSYVLNKVGHTEYAKTIKTLLE